MEGSLFHLTSETFVTPSLANIAAEISANTKWDLEDDQEDSECFTPITRQSSIAEELKRTRSFSASNYSDDSGDSYVNVEGKIQFLESALTYSGVWYYNTNNNCSEQSPFLYVKPRTSEAVSSPTPASPFYSPSLLNMSPGPIRPTFYGKDIVGKWSGDFSMVGKRANIQEYFELHCNISDNNSQEILAIYGEGHNLYGDFELTGEYEPLTMKMRLRKYYKKSVNNNNNNNSIDDPPYTPHDNNNSIMEHRVNLRKRRPSFLRSESDEYHSFSNLSFRLESPSKKRGRGRPYKRLNTMNGNDNKKRKLNNNLNGLSGYMGYSNINDNNNNNDKFCSVCCQYESPQDLFYKCISCGIVVHQSCYFIQPNQSRNNWKCDCCQYFDIPKTLYKTLSEYIQGIITNRSENKTTVRVKLSYSLPVSKLTSITNAPQIYTCLSLLEGKSKIVECQICNKKKGAMKMTTNKTWCHVRCVLFSRSFMNSSLNSSNNNCNNNNNNNNNMNSMDIKNQRYYQGCNDQMKKKPCFLCHKINGDIFQCCKWGCKYQFHINCSHSDDCLFIAYPSLLMDTCIPIIYCPDHADQYMTNYYKSGERLLPAHLESDGEIYSGQSVNGIREGFGVCLYSDSSMYEGDWHDGLMNGYGVLCNNYNEVVYEGEFEKGKKHGNGIYYFNNGDSYNGEWYQNKREGHGVYRTMNNEIYDCEWKNNEINGKGEYHCALVSYIGDWSKNLYDGNGIYRSCNGFEYSGSFKNGKMHGNGIIIYPDGKKFECVFKDGLLMEKRMFLSKMIQ